MNPKRFMVFVWNRHMAAGGLNDVVSSADSLDEAKAQLDSEYFLNWDFIQIFDRETGQLIEVKG